MLYLLLLSICRWFLTSFVSQHGEKSKQCNQFQYTHLLVGWTLIPFICNWFPLPMFPSGPSMRSVAPGRLLLPFGHFNFLFHSAQIDQPMTGQLYSNTLHHIFTSLHHHSFTFNTLHHIIVGHLPIWLKNSTDSSLRRIKRILNRNPSRKLPQIRPSDTVAAHLMVIHRLSNGWRHQRTRGSQSGSNAQDPSSDSLFCEIRWRGNYSWEQDGNALLAAGCKDGEMFLMKAS